MTIPFEEIVIGDQDDTLIELQGETETETGSKIYSKDLELEVKAYVPVTDVSLDESVISLETAEETKHLTATVAPESASNQGVTWSSDKENVATVSESGLITAVGDGMATIIATTKDGEKTASCTVIVGSCGEFKKNTLSLDDKIGIRFYMVLNDQFEYDRIGMKFWKKDKKECSLVVPFEDAVCKQIDGVISYAFRYEVVSSEMADTIVGEMVVRTDDGEWIEIGNEMNCSVQSLASKRLNSSNESEASKKSSDIHT